MGGVSDESHPGADRIGNAGQGTGDGRWRRIPCTVYFLWTFVVFLLPYICGRMLFPQAYLVVRSCLSKTAALNGPFLEKIFGKIHPPSHLLGARWQGLGERHVGTTESHALSL